MKQGTLFDGSHFDLKNEINEIQNTVLNLNQDLIKITHKLKTVCPHDKIQIRTKCHEDEYGRYVPEWTEVSAYCEFCGKASVIDKSEYEKLKLTPVELLMRNG